MDTNGNHIDLADLGQDSLKKLYTAVSETRKKKYQRRKGTKYGNLNKGFTDGELKKFFSFCNHPKAYACFFLMAHLGLRVGEVVCIKQSDIDFRKNIIRIETEKAGTIDYLYMPTQVRKLLLRLVQKLPENIAPEVNYLFASEMKDRKHISKHWLPRVFRETCELAGLNDTYGVAEDINKPKMKGSERKLYRLSTHSLRHYFITKVYNSCRDPIQTQKLARHLDFKSTQVYIHQNQDQLDETIQKVFGDKVTNTSKDDVKEMLTFFKFYKEMKDGS